MINPCPWCKRQPRVVRGPGEDGITTIVCTRQGCPGDIKIIQQGLGKAGFQRAERDWNRFAKHIELRLKQLEKKTGKKGPQRMGHPFRRNISNRKEA